jgi:dTMP kinase
LDVALARILDGRPVLKFHEAGLDMGWSADPYESFRMFQGRIFSEYEAMVTRFGFTVMDATREIHAQQMEVRDLLTRAIPLKDYLH